MSSVPKPTVVRPLYKQKSWSPDSQREAAWLRRKTSYHRLSHGRSQSFTNEDMDELQACFELGFGFDSTDLDPKLTTAFPALEFYNAVNKQYNNSLSRSSSSTISSDADTASPVRSPGSCSFFGPGEDPEVLKTRLKQWAQAVACSVRHHPPRTES